MIRLVFQEGNTITWKVIREEVLSARDLAVSPARERDMFTAVSAAQDKRAALKALPEDALARLERDPTQVLIAVEADK